MREIWKTIDEAPDYKVSNLGRVSSFRVYKEGYILKQKSDKDGYLEIQLTVAHGKKIWRRVHRLVANAFIPNPDNLPIVNHKDGNVKNNSVDNLEWCTNSYNISYSYRVLGKTWDKIRIGRAYTFHRVRATNIETGETQQFDCINDCARYYGVDDCCIRQRVYGRYRNPSNHPNSSLNNIFFESVGKSSNDHPSGALTQQEQG